MYYSVLLKAWKKAAISSVKQGYEKMLGKRIDVGGYFQDRNGKDMQLIELCPLVAMFTYGLQCPYLQEQFEYSRLNCYDLAFPEVRSCPRSATEDNPICYKTREVKYVETIKAARLIGKDFVAIDDIVDVKVGFIGGNGLWDQLGKRNQFAARVVEFSSMDLTLDISSEFWSRQVEIPYGKIESIKRREDKC